MKFADPKPPFCSSCFQHSTGNHVDFEAFYDGPVIEKDGTKIPVDDLILCEECVRRAGELLGMIDPKRALNVEEEAKAQLDAMKVELTAKDRVISDLQHTMKELVDHPVKRPGGRPRIRGVPKDVKAQLTKREERSEAIKAGKAAKAKREGVKA